MRYFIPVFMAMLMPQAAQAFEMAMPLDCKMGVECVVQNYVDHDPAKGATAYSDFTCGSLSYDDHKGTDIRAVNHAVMQRGINVLAAADGRVLGARDGVEDGAPVVENVECGNGVRISHKGGWITQYCHMKKGSIRVKEGDILKTGDVLGQMGLSGNTAFPHMHIQVEKDGQIMDPYSRTAMNRACAKTQSATLWNAEAAELLAYKPTGLLGVGFTTQKPKDGEIQQGKHRYKHLSGAEPVLLFWAEMYGVQAGDEAYIALRNPDKVVIAEQRQVITRNRAVQNYFVGKSNKEGMWGAGAYTGIITLMRAGEPVIKRVFTVKVGHE